MSLVNVRISGAAETALQELTANGLSVSEAVRDALVMAARLRRREQMRVEALRAMADPDDRAAVRRVMEDWDDVGAR